MGVTAHVWLCILIVAGKHDEFVIYSTNTLYHQPILRGVDYRGVSWLVGFDFSRYHIVAASKIWLHALT